MIIVPLIQPYRSAGLPVDERPWEVLYNNPGPTKMMFLYYSKRKNCKKIVDKYGETWEAVAERESGSECWEYLQDQPPFKMPFRN